MRLFQPFPDYSAPVPVPPAEVVRPAVPVYFIRYRYPHHARASGYDRLCDYLEGETIPLSSVRHLAGETILRIPAKIYSKTCGQYEYSRQDFVMELAARAHFKDHRNSIYHYVYGEKSYRLLSGLSGRNGNKIVLTVHHAPDHLNWLFRSVDHLRKADHVTVVSRSQISAWEDIVGRGRVTHIPYAVDVNYFKPGLAAGADAPQRCLFVGCHERDFDGLPELTGSILRANPRAEFCMISSDKRCGEVAAKNDRAVWRPRVDDAAYLQLLQTSKLLVLPLRKSTTCTAVLEAMACGLPVLTTRGGIEDYLDDRSSILFDAGDMGTMANEAVRLLNDSEAYANMSAAAVQKAAEYSWHQTAVRMAELYAGIMRT